MNKQEIQDLLKRASEAYYNGAPIISDDHYDALEYYARYTAVGAKPSHSKAEHPFRMYSLQKHYAKNGASPLQDFEGTHDIVSSPKLDGAAISIEYRNGVLYQALTRGDGKWGTIITEKVMMLSNVPTTINDTSPVVFITGEVVAPSSVENARNVAAGALNLLDISKFAEKPLKFFAYGIQPLRKTYRQDLACLVSNGFDVPTEALREIYPTDGTVYRLNDNELFESLGYTAKHPRGAYALKEESDLIVTTIKDVVWQVGKTGKVTPVAILDPVEVGDAIVARATLNNPGFIQDMDLEIGDAVYIVRSGDIIPKIVGKVERDGS